MIDIIFLVVLAVSLIGMFVIFWRRLPQIAELPETAPAPFHWKELLSKTKEAPFFRGISFEMLLQRMLSKTRVLILKTDNKTSNWLQRLREKSQKDKFGGDDTYWKDIKKSTRK